MPVHWDDLRFVLALKRAGTLGGAARLLKCEASTASRRLAALETELGVLLVTRTPEGVVLNEAGLATAELAETIDRGVADLVRRIGGEDAKPEGVVKIATTDSSAGFLMSGLVPLRDAYPMIRVELVVGNAGHDLLRREADLALRFFRDTSPTLVAKKLADVGWSIYASHAYVERTRTEIGDPVDPCRLVGHTFVGFSDEIARSPGGQWVAAHCRAEDIALRVGSITSMINAAKNGMGLAVMPCFAVQGITDLVRVTPAIVTHGEAFLVIPPDHRHTMRVRVVLDAITNLFLAQADMIAGR